MRVWRLRVCLWFVGLLWLTTLAPHVWGAAALPTLPQAQVDVTFPTTTSTCTATTSLAFQNCLNSSALGTEIVLTAGAVYTGTFTLPNKTTGTGWIVIRTSNMAGIPAAGTRVVPATHAAAMPKIQPPNSSSNAITAATSAHHYRFVGIEVRPQTNSFTDDLMAFGDGGHTSLAQLPHHLIWDRCYVHSDLGTDTTGTGNGISFYSSGADIAVIDSHFQGFRRVAFQAHAIQFPQSAAGPILIRNNHLNSNGGNIGLGGGAGNITNLQPHDITIQRNYFTKSLTWNPNHPSYGGIDYANINHMEFSYGVRSLVEGNIFENNWDPEQHGNSFGAFPKGASFAGNPWNTVQDLTVRHNWWRGAGRWMSYQARPPALDITIPAARLHVHNNLMQDMRTSMWDGDGKALTVLWGFADVTFEHNTVINTGSGIQFFAISETGGFDNPNFTARNNIFFNNVDADTGTTGSTAITQATSGTVIFTNNLLVQGTSGNYGSHPGNFFLASPTTGGAAGCGVCFVTYNGGDYALGGDFRLAANSPYNNAGTDGLDLGADIAAMNAAIAGTVATLPTLPQVQVNGGDLSVPSVVTTINCPSGCNLQSAIDDAANNAGNTEIVLQAGAIYSGRFFLRNQTGSHWTIIRTDNMAGIPAAGQRVDPALHAAAMPKLQNAGAFEEVISTDVTAHHYRLIGLEVRATPGQFVWHPISIGTTANTTQALTTHHIILDRLYIHGDANLMPSAQTGVHLFDWSHLAIINSDIREIKSNSAQAVGIGGNCNYNGPLLIENNMIQASAENIHLFGCDGGVFPQVQPLDTTIKRNHLFKQPAWNANVNGCTNHPGTANLFELKGGQRLLFDGNILENSWADPCFGDVNHFGAAMVITPRGNDRGGFDYSWIAIKDITFTNNIIRHVGRGWTISGYDPPFTTPAQLTERFLIKNNVFEDMGAAATGSDGIFGTNNYSSESLIVEHNTIVTGGSLLQGFNVGDVVGIPPATNYVFRNNIARHGTGVQGTNPFRSDGCPTLTDTAYFTSPIFLANVLIAGPSGNYTACTSGNFFPATVTTVQFVNYNNGNGGDYNLAAGSPYNNAATDGTDIGVDMAALNAAQAGTADVGPPTQVPSLALTVLSPTSIRLDWLAATDDIAVTNYRIYRCSGALCTPIVHTTVGNVLTFTDTLLTASTLYRYQVSALDAVPNEGARSAIQQATTQAADTTPPSQVSAPSLMVLSSRSIQLSWVAATDAVGVTNYLIYRCSGTACTPTLLTTLGNVLTFTDTNLNQNTLYRYQVSARDAANNEGARSPIQQATTLPPGAVVHIPFTEAASPSASTIGGLSCVWNGTPARVTPGAFGDGITVDGSTNSWLNCGSGTSAAPQLPYTVAFWARVAGALVAPFNGVMGRTTGENWDNGWGFYFPASSQLRFFVNSFGNEAFATVPVLNQWNHMVGIYDGATVRLSVNGVDGTPFALTAAATAGGILRLGQLPDSSYDTPGLSLDELWIFDYALSSQEITNLRTTNNVTVVTDPNPPALSAGAPTGTLAAATTSVQLRLTATDATAPITCRHGTSDLVFASLPNIFGTTGCTGGSTHCSTISGLTPGVKNFFARCQDGVTPTPNTNTTGFPITFTINSAPTVPGNLVATQISSTQINLIWNASTDDVSVTNYRVERCQGSACSSFVEIAQTTVTNRADTLLTPGTLYRYRVRAWDGLDFGGYSAIAEQFTASETLAPKAPTNPTAQPVSSVQINLSCTPPTQNTDNSPLTDLVGHRITSCAGVGCLPNVVLTPDLGTTCAVSHTGLTGGQTYGYKFQAFDDETPPNFSPDSTIVYATTPAIPNPPTGLQVIPNSPTQLTLSWVAPTQNMDGSTPVNLNGYRVTFCQGVLCTPVTDLTPDLAVVTSFQHQSLQMFTTYGYRLRAKNPTGDLSPNSLTVYGRTLDGTAPSAPSSLVVVRYESALRLTWGVGADAESGVSNQRLYRCAGVLCTPILIRTLGIESTTDDGNLSAETVYRYQVSTVNGEGLESSLSNIAEGSIESRIIFFQ